jgi:phage tail protein X
MPRDISAPNLAAIQQNRLVARDFLWIIARDRVTGAAVPDGTWSDYGNVTASVINPNTGLAESRDFYGSGTLIQMSDIPLVLNLTVQNVTVEFSQTSDHIDTLIRQYDVKQAPVEIYRGLFDPETRKMVAPAEARFVGYIDDVVVTTPSENSDGSVQLTCASSTQEMTRSNTETRSHENQIIRNNTDAFFKDSATTTTWKIWWGQQKGTIA